MTITRAEVAPPEFLIPARCATEWAALSDALVGAMPPCVGAPDVWTEGVGDESVKAACWSCPAQVECLAYAVAAGERFGIWGGFGPTERKTLVAGKAS
ncbi:WhiB family transcriptional regulator [Knoellia sp. CPCC 206453]|uniref:WhiB family transcriptional regulator n=1 Tax=Knoellia pratensis TaxID=3404796 RepID=UPI00361732D4